MASDHESWFKTTSLNQDSWSDAARDSGLTVVPHIKRFDSTKGIELFVLTLTEMHVSELGVPTWDSRVGTIAFSRGEYNAVGEE